MPGCLRVVLLNCSEGYGQELKVQDEFSTRIRDGKLRLIELTHTLERDSPYWPENQPGSPFSTSVTTNYEKDGNFTRCLRMPEHFGTHMDAPVHFDPDGVSVDRIAAELFFAPAVVINVSSAVATNTDYCVTAQDIESWMAKHGSIPAGAMVFFQTGWAARWPSQEKYMNMDAGGVLHFPGLSLQAAQYLLGRSHPVGIGIDTASIDYGPSTDFPVHQLTMPAGVYHLENVANLDKLPPTGFSVIALPLKLEGGSGAPARVVALVPTESENLH
jgi:kynurenine formamidase